MNYLVLELGYFCTDWQMPPYLFKGVYNFETTIIRQTGYFSFLFSSLLKKKREEKKENELIKPVLVIHSIFTLPYWFKKNLRIKLYLPIVIYIFQSIYIYLYHSMCLSIYLYIFIHILIPFYISIYLFLYLSIFLYIYLYTYISIYLFISIYVYRRKPCSIYLDIKYIYLTIYLLLQRRQPVVICL